MNRRRVRRLIVVGIVLGAVFGQPVLAAVSGYLSNSATVTGPVPLSASDGPTIVFEGEADVNLTNPASDANTVSLRTSKGNITFRSSAEVNASIQASAINGTWTNVTKLDVSGTALTISPEDKRSVTVEGETRNLSFRNAKVDDSVVDFVYSGASGTTNLTLHGLTADVVVAAIDRKTKDVLGSATTNSNGTVTISMHNSEHAVLLQTSNGAPSVSNPTPTGTLSTAPSELSVEISDPDFPNDNVSVEFFVDGASVGTTSTTSKGEVSVNVSNLTRGPHNASVVATDEFGSRTTTNWSFAVPDRLYARNVSNTSQILDDQKLTFTFYEEDGDVLTRPTTNGSVSLTGLDPSASISVQVEAPGNATTNTTAYYTRTFLLRDIGTQETVYMLPKSASSVYNQFVLNDLSGEYPSAESALVIQRAINRSGSVGWEAVTGDRFSADSTVKTHLAQDERYRILVVNDDGDQRVLGGYVAATDGAVSLTIGSVRWDVEKPESIVWSSRTINLTAQNSEPFGYVHFQFLDPQEATTNLHVVIHEQGNASNEIYNQTAPGPFGQFSLNQTISGGQVTNTTWVVEWSADTGNRTLNGSQVVSAQRYPIDNPFDSKWGPTLVAGVILFTALIFGGLNSNIGAVATGGVASVLWYLGWYEASAGIILLALAVGGLFIIGDGQGAGGR